MSKWVKIGWILVLVGILAVFGVLLTGADTFFYRTEGGRMIPGRFSTDHVDDYLDRMEAGLDRIEDNLSKEWGSWLDWTDFGLEDWVAISTREEALEKWLTHGRRSNRRDAVTLEELDTVTNLSIDVQNYDVRLLLLDRGEQGFVAYEADGAELDIAYDGTALSIEETGSRNLRLHGKPWRLCIGLTEDRLPSFQLQSENGDLVVERLSIPEGSLDLINGDVVLVDVGLSDGELLLQNGDMVSAHTEFSDMRLVSQNGDVVMNQAEISGVDMNMQNGDAILDVERFGGHTQITARNGDLILRVPRDQWGKMERQIRGGDIYEDGGIAKNNHAGETGERVSIIVESTYGDVMINTVP